MIREQTYMPVCWHEAQRVADWHRRRGIRIHVCQLNKGLHVL